MRAALITISSSRSRGEGEDESGERLAAFATGWAPRSPAAT